MKKNFRILSKLYFFCILCIGLSSVVSCSNSNKGNENVSETDSIKNDTIVSQKWNYSSKRDEMNGNENHFASLNSINSFTFDFPYNNGNAYLNLLIRNMNHKNEVLLILSQGQILSSMNHYIDIKFDNNNPIHVNFSEADDLSTGYAFLENPNSLIKKIKKAKNIKIQIPIFQEGNRVFNFDIPKLDWNY